MNDSDSAPRDQLLGSAAEWAERIHQELVASPSEEPAFRCLIGLSDDLGAADPAARAALCAIAPALCGDPRFDAGIAGVVEYHLTSAGLEVPAWVGDPSRVLLEEWVVSPYIDPGEVSLSVPSPRGAARSIGAGQRLIPRCSPETRTESVYRADYLTGRAELLVRPKRGVVVAPFEPEGPERDRLLIAGSPEVTPDHGGSLEGDAGRAAAAPELSTGAGHHRHRSIRYGVSIDTSR